MGDLFSSYSNVPSEVYNSKFEQMAAYEKHYMDLLRNYKNEIADIERMMKDLRAERQKFYSSTLPEIEERIRNDNILSRKSVEEWILELRSNVERSFRISEELISYYVTSNQKEFKDKMNEAINGL